MKIKWFGFKDRNGKLVWMQSESAILDLIKKIAINKVIKISETIYQESINN